MGYGSTPCDFMCACVPQDLVKEFLASSDAEEAARCWHDLDVSFFGHQLVFTILVAAFEAPAQAQLLQQLIQRFALSGEVSQVPCLSLGHHNLHQ